MAKNKFEALPGFLGGKRKLLKYITPHFKDCEVVADVFMGGGSVSLEIVWAGKKVIANDIAYRSKVIGTSLIANRKTKLTDEDIYGLFLPSENDGFIEKNFCPKYMTRETAKFLDIAFANVRKLSSPKREMSELALYKFIMNQRQFGGFGHNGDQKMITAGKEMELLEMASSSRGNKVKNILSHPLPQLLKIKDQINDAICANAERNEFFQMDCFEFLEMLKRENRKVDVAYFDSPYKDSLVYSSHYKVLDSILEGKLNVGIEDRAFNKSDALESFEKLIVASEWISKLVFSMGYNPKSKSGIKGEELLAVVQKFRPAKLYYLDHIWAINNITCKDGKAKGQEENVEYLIVTE
jgi:adenine-specific DNA methylase